MSIQIHNWDIFLNCCHADLSCQSPSAGVAGTHSTTGWIPVRSSIMYWRKWPRCRLSSLEYITTGKLNQHAEDWGPPANVVLGTANQFSTEARRGSQAMPDVTTHLMMTREAKKGRWSFKWLMKFLSLSDTGLSSSGNSDCKWDKEKIKQAAEVFFPQHINTAVLPPPEFLDYLPCIRVLTQSLAGLAHPGKICRWLQHPATVTCGCHGPGGRAPWRSMLADDSCRMGGCGTMPSPLLRAFCKETIETLTWQLIEFFPLLMSINQTFWWTLVCSTCFVFTTW